MARMSLAQLNELLGRALREHGGLVTPDPDAFKPWLPISYWAQLKVEQETAADLIKAADLAKAQVEYAKRQRQQEDEMLANMSVEELIGDPPGLFKPSVGHVVSGWGTRSMRPSAWNTKAPTPGNQQPQYHFECCQCGLPITVDGYDHDHNRLCDLALMDPAVFESEDHDVYHTPKPWKGEEEEDEDEDD